MNSTCARDVGEIGRDRDHDDEVAFGDLDIFDGTARVAGT